MGGGKKLHEAAEQFAPELSIEWEVRAITDREAGVPDRIFVDLTAALYWYVHGQEYTYVLDETLRINLQAILKITIAAMTPTTRSREEA